MFTADKSTDDLLKELKDKNTEFQAYIDANPDSFIERNLKQFWNDIVKRSRMKKVNIINSADCGYTFFYGVLNGQKIPSKDMIVRLMLAMHMTLEDCQKALLYCGRAPLYPRIKEDSIYIYAIEHGLTVKAMREEMRK